MRNKDCQCVVCEQAREDARQGKKKRRVNWFTDHEVLHIEPSKQREVLLNPGYQKEWFRKTYPVKGELVLNRTEYIKDLPPRVPGRIIAVTAVSKYTGAIPGMGGKKFDDIKDTMPYKELSEKGLLKAKPIGNFFELFEGGGLRVWVNPKEYVSKHSRKARRRKQRAHGRAATK